MSGQRQIPNPSRIHPGVVFYESYGCVNDDGQVETGLYEWWVRSVRRPVGQSVKHAYLVRKAEWTWVRKSPRKGDYGWASSIALLDRARFQLGEALPEGLFSTPLRAVKHDLKLTEERLRSGIEGDESDREDRRIATALRARLTRMKSKK